MKRMLQILRAAALAATLVAGAAATGTASDSPSPDSTQTAELNGPHVLREKKVRLTGESNVVRSGPGDTFAMLGIYSRGAEFVVIAKKNEWYNIRLSDVDTGWIHSSLCKEFDDMSDLEFRPNPRLFSRVGSFAVTPYTGGYTFDRKSNSLVLGGRVGYYVLDFLVAEGNVGWTHVVRPAEIVESLFNLALEEEDFHMLFYSLNLNVILLPGRQMVPFITGGWGSSIMQGQTESSINYGIGANFFVDQALAVRFEFRNYSFESGNAEARRDNTNFEFSVGASFFL